MCKRTFCSSVLKSFLFRTQIGWYTSHLLRHYLRCHSGCLSGPTLVYYASFLLSSWSFLHSILLHFAPKYSIVFWNSLHLSSDRNKIEFYNDMLSYELMLSPVNAGGVHYSGVRTGDRGLFDVSQIWLTIQVYFSDGKSHTVMPVSSNFDKINSVNDTDSFLCAVILAEREGKEINYWLANLASRRLRDLITLKIMQLLYEVHATAR